MYLLETVFVTEQKDWNYAREMKRDKIKCSVNCSWIFHFCYRTKLVKFSFRLKKILKASLQWVKRKSHQELHFSRCFTRRRESKTSPPAPLPHPAAYPHAQLRTPWHLHAAASSIRRDTGWPRTNSRNARAWPMDIRASPLVWAPHAQIRRNFRPDWRKIWHGEAHFPSREPRMDAM
jgi:hypothetical protein